MGIPEHGGLLAARALADDFAKNGYDRRRVIRTILSSRTYQLSSRKNEFNVSDTKYFSHARTRLLSPRFAPNWMASRWR